MTADAVLTVDNLRVSFGATDVVRGISFAVAAGECVAIVGESGSGKSVTARALLGLAGAGSTVTATQLRLEATAGERDLLRLKSRQWRTIRGGEVGLVLQDALVSLDPLRPVGREIDDVLRLHTTLSPVQRRARVREVLTSVGMPDPDIRAKQRSGELSGGLRQRALIASAIAASPALLIADEPTTALDVTIQAQILDLLADLRRGGTGMLLISHDLSVVQHLADRVAVMHDGVIVEQGPTDDVLTAPQHEYTRRLLRSVPSGAPRGQRLSLSHGTALDAGSQAPAPARSSSASHEVLPHSDSLLVATDLSKTFGTFTAVDGVSLHLEPASTLGLVGESGSGKTTVARMLLGLTEPDSGSITLLGSPWSSVPERARRDRRPALGAVYQDALSSFDPRATVDDILRDAAGDGSPRSVSTQRIAELLDSVGLPSTVTHRRPLHLSGGQRQRVSIARAIAPSPQIIVCDEPVSALDVSVQAQVLDLLDDLQRDLGLSYLFISHDLGVVQHMSDRVAVMQGGRIVEHGDAAEIFARPAHPYTKALLAAAPTLSARRHLDRSTP